MKPSQAELRIRVGKFLEYGGEGNLPTAQIFKH
jgi:hypothetical protein